MTRAAPIEVARRLVRDRFPDAEQAWLAGSVVRGEATATSDLDITVLDETVLVHQESLCYEGWPVELFVNCEAGIRHFVAKDLSHRKPSTARLVAHGVALIPGAGGAELRDYCEHVLTSGPGRMSPEDLTAERYALSDLLDDLRASAPGPIGTAIAVKTWRCAIELVLAVNGRWNGGGKWLARELLAFDLEAGTTWTSRLDHALRRALEGDSTELEHAATAVLDEAGGRLWEGYYQAARVPDGGWESA